MRIVVGMGESREEVNEGVLQLVIAVLVIILLVILILQFVYEASP